MRFWCIAFLIALATCVSARDDADEIARQQFTGTWILNSKKSSAPSVRDKEVWIHYFESRTFYFGDYGEISII